jgi:starch synthase
MMILMVAAEFSPYMEAGPSALVVPQLSRALVQLGHDVSVVLPKLPSFEEGGLLVARRLSPLELPGGGAATIFDGKLGSGVKLILVDGPQGSAGQEPATADGAAADGAAADLGAPEANANDIERLGFFAQAVAAFVQERQRQGSPFDAVHCFDWAGALSLLHLKQLEAAPPCLFSWQDTRRLGPLSAATANGLRLPQDLLRSDALQSSGQLSGGVSVLKGGLVQADGITLAAPELLAELSDESRYGALAVIVAQRAAATTGILPGLDYAVYNPATDAELVSRYDAQHLAAKGNCRTALVRELGLEMAAERPLVAMLVRRGHDASALKSLVSRLVQNEINLVVVGDGASEIGPLPESAQRSCTVLDLKTSSGSWAMPGSAGERRLFAAADFVLFLDDGLLDALPLRRAQRYAAVPLVRAAGAARGAVVDCDAQLETGTGFLFESMAEVPGTVQRALAAYRGPSWPRLQRRVASLDLSWDRVAQRYQKLYRQLQR